MNSTKRKLLVARAYDKIGGAYGRQATRGRTEQRSRYEAAMLDRLPAGARVLDLGCGSGIPSTRRLARRFQVTGVDVSTRQVARARDNVPGARFICADMGSLEFAPGSFDGVCAYYSIIHLPRQEQGALLRSIAGWLRQGGLLVCTLGTHSDEAGFDPKWMGAPMFWSSFDSATNRDLVEESGFRIITAREETTSAHGDSETFLWVVAEKPG
jgi:SAM-dependent methyltransferase